VWLGQSHVGQVFISSALPNIHHILLELPNIELDFGHHFRRTHSIVFLRGSA
jgi:hypothetical protein